MISYCVFPDLSEFGQLSSWNIPYDKLGNYMPVRDRQDAYVKQLRTLEENAGTEFAFATTAEYQNTENASPQVGIALTALGWIPVGKRLNWSRWHNGSPPVTIWFRHLVPGASQQPGPRRRYAGNTAETLGGYCKHHVAYSCGAKLIDAVGRPGPYVALWRRPVELRPRQLSLMKTRGWRHVATGSLASYWVNGFTPDEWTIGADQLLRQKQSPAPTPKTNTVWAPVRTVDYAQYVARR